MVRDGCQQLTAIPGMQAAAATFSPPFGSRMGLSHPVVRAANAKVGELVGALSPQLYEQNRSAELLAVLPPASLTIEGL
jgi:hypothetical protein